MNAGFIAHIRKYVALILTGQEAPGSILCLVVALYFVVENYFIACKDWVFCV